MSVDIETQLNKLAQFVPTSSPILSLYLNTQPNDRGRDQFTPWIRKEFAERGRAFANDSQSADSFRADQKRIETWLSTELDVASNGVAIFACAAADNFFEAIQLAAPIQQNELHVHDQPHLYPLARLIDQYPRYAAVLADTHSARIFVFGLNRLETETGVQNPKTNRSMVGGWSQARYQRHTENFHKRHAREVTDILDRIMRDEGLQQFVLAGDQEVVVPLLKAEMPKHLSEKMVEVLRAPLTDSESSLLSRSMEALRAEDERHDADRVEYLIGEFRAGGLAVTGVINTLTALENGQVDELVIVADTNALETPEEALALASDFAINATDAASLIANLLVTKAEQTSAKLTFIENPDLLRQVGGCGAILRFRMDNAMPKKGNYNQDYYKVRGKEPGNQDVFPEKTKAAPKRSAARKPKAQKSTTRKAG